LSLAFTAGSDNGRAITKYQDSTDGINWSDTDAGTTSPRVASGLSNGTNYTMRLRAVNVAGSGTSSATFNATSTTPYGAPTATTNSGSDTTSTPSAPTTNAPTNLQSFGTLATVQLTSGSGTWTNPYPSGAATGTGTLNGSSGTTSFIWGTSSGSYPNEVGATSNAYAGTTWSRATTVYYKAKITNTSCALQFTGTVNANGNSTTVTFEYGTSSGVYPSSVSAGTVTGASNTAVSANLSSLGAGTYYFRVKAVNARGTTYGSQQSVAISAKSTVASNEQSFTPPHVGTIYNVVVVGGGGGGYVSGGGGGGASASSDRPVSSSLSYTVGGGGSNQVPFVAPTDGGGSSLTNGSWTMTGSGGLKANISYPESGGSCGSGSGGTVYNSSALGGGSAGYGCEDYAGGGGAGINGGGGNAYFVDIPNVSYILYAGGGGAGGGLFGEVTVSSGGGGLDAYLNDGDQSAGTPACDFGGGGSTSTAGARAPQGGVVRFRYYGP